jgi:D-alanyl-D-alanine carboxypeptidase
VVVAEAIAGDEDAFAKLMTRKAQALGMSRTIYKNASGLPDSNQITTARDQSTLGRAVQERFPRYYKYFSIRTFVFRGQSIGNHNHLLGRVEGVDGIKTGYVNASGFNLVTSVHRGNRYLVAVVMGGSSAGSRDAKMRDLISDKIAQASVKRTAPMVAEGSPPPEARPEPKAVAKVETKPEPKVAAKTEANKTEAKPEPKAEARFAVASAVSLPVRLNSAPAGQTDLATTRTESMAAAAQPRTAAGSTDPIRPVLVKTLSVKAGTTASLAPMHVSAPAPTEPAPVRAAAPVAAPAPVVAVKPEPPTPQPAPVVVAAAKPEPAPAPFPPPVAAKIEAPLPALVTASKPDVPALSFAPIAAKAEPAAAPVASPARVAAAEPAPAPARASAPAAKPQHRSGWIIQVGAFPGEQEAKKRLASAQTKAAKLLTKAEAFTETVEKGGTTLYRARFAGLDKDSAEAACKYLKRNDVECVTIKN